MKRKILFIALLFIVLTIGFLHFATPAELIFFHDTYRRLSYFPIVLGAIWFGVKGGLVLAVLSSVAFIPHLLLFAGHGFQSYYSELTEILLYIAAGLVVGIITERERKLRIGYQQVSNQLEESYEHLHEGAAQLIEAEEQLAASQKMSALGEMAASLAHEVRNPLSSIRGTAEILLDDYPLGHPKREFVEILLKESEHLDETLKNTLDFSKTNDFDVEENDSISSIIRKQKLLLSPRLKKEKINFELNYLDSGENFLVPAARISQVLFNVLINGIEALGVSAPSVQVSDGDRLNVEQQGTSARIRLDLEMTTNGCRLHICDSGPGIGDELKERIFESFYTGKKEGTGLGLAISRKIVERYGGSLTVTDSDLGGACFSLYLPSKANRDPLDRFMLSTGRSKNND